MLICYNGEVTEVKRTDTGCSVCRQASADQYTLQYVREKDYYLTNGQRVHFVKDRPRQVPDIDALALLDLTYTTDGIVYDKFTVVN